MGNLWIILEPNERRGTNSVAKTGQLMFDNYPNCGQYVGRWGLKSLSVIDNSEFWVKKNEQIRVLSLPIVHSKAGSFATSHGLNKAFMIKTL